VTLPGNTISVGISPKNVTRMPSDSSICMLTGLSEQTTLTIRVRYWVERFPSDAEPEILPLTRSSARFDPLALEAYSKWVSRAPPGCRFTENPDGEWWGKTLGNLASIIGPMISMIPHPIAKAVGTGATFAGPLLTGLSDGKSKVVVTKANQKVVKKKQLKKKNESLNQGGRGKKGNVQGPMREYIPG